MVINSIKKEVKNYEILNNWANTIKLRRQLMKDDDLYLDELYLLSFIYVMGQSKQVSQLDLSEGFNIVSYKREKMILNLINRGYLQNATSKRYVKHNYVVTVSGEQLLIKYKKVMERLCEEM